MRLKLLVLLLLFVTVSYADSETCIVIKNKGGNETLIELSSNPIVTFSGSDMLIVSDNAQYQWSLDDIDEYRFSQTASGIQDVTIVSQKSKGHVVLSGIPNNTPVVIYSIDGRMIKQYVTDESGHIDINLRELPRGVYLIKANKTSFKVLNN